MRARQQGWLLTAIAAGVLTGAVAMAGLEESPRDHLERVTAELFDSIRANADGDSAALQALVEKIVEPELDREKIISIILGKARYAETAPEARMKLYNALKGMMFRLYADALYASRDGTVTYLPFEEDPSKSYQIVKSRFSGTADGEPLEILYLVRPVDERWRVFEMRVDGIFLIRNLRDTLGPEIERDGIESVIARLCQAGREGTVPSGSCG